MIVGFSLDLFGGPPRKQPGSTRWSGQRFQHSGVLPSPGQGLLHQGQCLSDRTRIAMGMRRERDDSTVFSIELVNSKAHGPCRKQGFSDLRLWQPP